MSFLKTIWTAVKRYARTVCVAGTVAVASGFQSLQAAEPWDTVAATLSDLAIAVGGVIGAVFAIKAIFAGIALAGKLLNKAR